MKEEGGRTPKLTFTSKILRLSSQVCSRNGLSNDIPAAVTLEDVISFSCRWQHFRDVAKRRLREDTRSQSSGLLELAESEGVDIEEMVFEQTLDRGLCKGHLGRDDCHIGNAVVRVQGIY